MSRLAEGPVAAPTTRAVVAPLHFVLFYHSVVSDWNNGNAHFLRGIVRDLTTRGHHVTVYEPRNGWSIQNLEAEMGPAVEHDFQRQFPDIQYVRYNPELLQLDEVLDTADVVIVHEWNDHSLVADIGQHHRFNPGYTLLFHDTHHRSVTDPAAMASYDLSEYDGVLAFGTLVRDIYLANGWTQRAWTIHEAADVTLFYPRTTAAAPEKDILWIGNWGDEERTAELHEYFFEPVRQLGLSGTAHGVRYPAEALAVLDQCHIDYRGWLPNAHVPETAATHRLMIHVPRRPYVASLPGIPTIRPFEAMACGIPLVSSYWNDTENLFTEGRDYLMARTPDEMKRNIRLLLNDEGARQELASHALRTVCAKHTCSHRVDELLQIVEELAPTTKLRKN